MKPGFTVTLRVADVPDGLIDVEPTLKKPAGAKKEKVAPMRFIPAT